MGALPCQATTHTHRDIKSIYLLIYNIIIHLRI